MKNLKALLISFLLIGGPVAVFASDSDALTKNNIDKKSETEVRARVEILTSRIDQIRAMNPTEMDDFERQSVKDELKEIKKELKVANTGTVTISVGAAIIIVLLLIIFF